MELIVEVLFRVAEVGVGDRVVVVVRSVLEDGVVVEGVESVDEWEDRVKALLTLVLRGIVNEFVVETAIVASDGAMR